MIYQARRAVPARSVSPFRFQVVLDILVSLAPRPTRNTGYTARIPETTGPPTSTVNRLDGRYLLGLYLLLVFKLSSIYWSERAKTGAACRGNTEAGLRRWSYLGRFGLVLEMDLNTVTTFLGMHLDKWCQCSEFFCSIRHTLGEHKQTSQLLGACGHDNRKLEAAIAGAEKAFDVLVAARMRAVVRFKADCVCFTMDESRRRKIETARLQ